MEVEVVTDATNPGCVNPANQAFAPPPAPRAGSARRVLQLPATSNGEIQVKCDPGVLRGSPSLQGGSAAVTQSSGETQLVDLKRAEAAEATCRGLPANRSGDASRPGGLPVEVNIK